MIYDICPVTAPRMTSRDKWGTNKRPCVERYHAYRDEVKLKKVKLPVYGSHVIFTLPMPNSWPNKKKAQFDGKPHQLVRSNDVDNLLKALMDSVYANDGMIWDIRCTKIWGYEGQIEIV